MEPFRVHILGCGSALPTPKHYASSQVVEVRGKSFMIDCGEGTQIAMRRSRISFANLTAVFISHLHGDHCLGLVGMISTFGMLGRTQKFHVYAHPALGPMLKSQLEMFCPNLEYEVEFHGIDTEQKKTIYEDRSLMVETIPLEHRVPCCGFLFREKQGLPHIRREMIDFYQIPVSQINNIKNGSSWTTPDGEVIPSERLTRPADLARSYAYCSDTRYIPRLHEMIKGVNLLYHEATYADDRADRAGFYFHSTAREAGKVARCAGVGHLVIGHFSARYDDETALLRQAREEFENTDLAAEQQVFDVK
ncbi:MAG: ribonuclease Z [Prevotella sp.]|nr:ribonuclease Z [Prevotella sp.]